MLRIDVAVRKPDENEYTRAILVDTMTHYAIPDAVERYVTRPAILRAVGWDVEQVLGKDWVLRPPRRIPARDRGGGSFPRNHRDCS